MNLVLTLIATILVKVELVMIGPSWLTPVNIDMVIVSDNHFTLQTCLYPLTGEN